MIKSSALYSKPFLGKVIEFFFVYAWIWSTIRLLVIGRGQISSLSETLIAVSPDIILIFILFLSIRILLNEGLLLGWNKTEKFFLFFFATNIVLGFILGYDAGFGIAIRGFRLTYWPMAFFFIAKIFWKDRSEFEKLLENIFRWFVVFALAGIIVHFFMKEFSAKMMGLAGYPEEMRYFIPRMSPFVWAPILFGMLMAYASVFYCYKIFTTEKKIYYFFLAVLWFCMLLSVSRGAILSFLISFAAMTFFSKKYKKSIFIFSLLLVVYFLVSSLFSLGGNFLFWLFSSTADTLSFHEGISRVEQWRKTIQNFLDRPWGYGFGKSGFIAHWYLTDSNIPCAPYITDGWFLKLACETGVYGVLSYFAFSVFYFLKVISQKDEMKFLSIGFFLLVNAMNVPSNSLDYYPFVSIFWLILGYSASSITETIKKHAH